MSKKIRILTKKYSIPVLLALVKSEPLNIDGILFELFSESKTKTVKCYKIKCPYCQEINERSIDDKNIQIVLKDLKTKYKGDQSRLKIKGEWKDTQFDKYDDQIAVLRSKFKKLPRLRCSECRKNLLDIIVTKNKRRDETDRIIRNMPLVENKKGLPKDFRKSYSTKIRNSGLNSLLEAGIVKGKKYYQVEYTQIIRIILFIISESISGGSTNPKKINYLCNSKIVKQYIKESMLWIKIRVDKYRYSYNKLVDIFLNIIESSGTFNQMCGNLIDDKELKHFLELCYMYYDMVLLPKNQLAYWTLRKMYPDKDGLIKNQWRKKGRLNEVVRSLLPEGYKNTLCIPKWE